jgi:hypothetical protein
MSCQCIIPVTVLRDLGKPRKFSRRIAGTPADIRIQGLQNPTLDRCLFCVMYSEQL